MNANLMNYLESKGIEIYFDEKGYDRYDIEKYKIGRGYESKFIELMRSYTMSYNFWSNSFFTHMFKTNDIKEILLYDPLFDNLPLQ